MAQHDVLLLNETVPQLQEPQAGDTYRMPADVEIVGNLTISGTVDGADVAATAALAASATQPGDNLSTLVNDILASQAEAEAGTNNTKMMTPLRVAQAIAILAQGLKNNTSATVAPTTTNDDSEGYAIGSFWVDTVADESYRCVDATTNLAVWVKTTLSSNDLATVALSGDSDDLIEGAVQLLLTVAERALIASAVQPASADVLTNKTIDAALNTLSNIGVSMFNTDTADAFGLMYGSTLDSVSENVTSDGVNITFSFEKSGGGDVRFLFSDGVHLHDCTPAATATLTAGTDTVPVLNYIYLDQATKNVVVNTTGWPSGAEHAHLATVLVQSAATVQTDGPLKFHAWTDHAHSESGTNVQGHLAHINEWIREQPATWRSGVALTPSVGAGVFDIATTAGEVLQLHGHSFPAFNTAGGDFAWVPNHPDTAFKKVGDLTIANIDKDANGTVLGGASADFWNLVIWGSVNETDGSCKLFCNVPDGVYPSNAGNQATLDLSNTAVYDIPDEFKGTGFLIARITVSYSGGTYTIEQNKDLRGSFPSASAGGGSSSGSLPITYTVATLPAGTAGMMAQVSDGTAAIPWGDTVTGGGSTRYLVWYNGSNWTVLGE